MSAADGGDEPRVPGNGEPIVNGRADPAALNRRFAGSVMTGN